jgi:hypothetical protein
MVVTRDPSKVAGLRQDGADVAIADVHDVEALRRIFDQGRRLFLLNPPAAPSSDTAAEERRSLGAGRLSHDGALLLRDGILEFSEKQLGNCIPTKLPFEGRVKTQHNIGGRNAFIG